MKEPVFIESQIAAALVADAALAALVGAKVFPVMIPERTILPCVVYQRVYSQPATHLQGYQREQVTIRVTAFAFTYVGVKAIALRIRAAMAAAPIKAIFRSDDDHFDPDSKVYSTSAEYICAQTGGFCYGPM